MSKLYSSRKIINTLEKHNFIFISQKGSHAKYKNISKKLTVIVPTNRKEIPVGTFYSICRQAKLNPEDFK